MRAHTRSKLLLTLTVTMLLVATAPAKAQALDDTEPTEAIASARALPGRLLVQPKGGVTSAELNALFGHHKLARIKRIRGIDVHIVELAPARLAAAERALRRDPRIRFVERDRKIAPSPWASDPFYSDQYHLPRINCPGAWEVTVGAAAAPIAVLDSGIDASHPDLSSKLMAGYNTFDNNTDTGDVYGHGTMVAGVAAAASDNAVGITGVSWDNPIMPIRVTDTEGYAYISTLAAGLVWAADHGAKVANMSFAVFGAEALDEAARYFSAKGGVVFAAAGNDGAAHDDAPNPWVISVAATDRDDRRAAFSSYGPYVDLAAPGVAIATTGRGGVYVSASGTSFASPIAAGVAGLLWGANPDLTATQVIDLLAAHARDLGAPGYDHLFGWGRVDAANAVAAATLIPRKDRDTTVPLVSILSPASGATVTGMVTVEVDAADDVAVEKVSLFVGRQLVGTKATAPYVFVWDSSGANRGPQTIVAVAYDSSGNWDSSDAVTVEVRQLASRSRATVAPKSKRLAQRHPIRAGTVE
jgi:thermitase